jgi:hypothetical protein
MYTRLSMVTVVIYPPFIIDMSKRPRVCPAANGMAKIKHFSLNIKKVEFLMKLKRGAYMKEISAGVKVCTTTIYGL